tara:strand:+ start:316 stop:963 length:648 start_codon:yes stop_codon:yes gene_type:complete
MSEIYIIDDHPVMRFGLVALIDAEKDLKVIGQAGTAAEAFADLQIKAPDLVLIDVTLPDKNGLELVKDLRAIHSNLLVLIVSMHDENTYAERALRAGARGYVMKEEAPDKLVQAVRQVLTGGVFVSDAVSARIVQNFANGRSAQGFGIGRLTDRELEVFRLLGEGKASREIAGMLHISVRTIDAHRTHIKEKLGFKDATELMHQAVKWVETGELD